MRSPLQGFRKLVKAAVESVFSVFKTSDGNTFITSDGDTFNVRN